MAPISSENQTHPFFNKFEFRADKSLYWPERKTLIVADLHLEKGSYYAAKGQLLPPYDTETTLTALQKSVNETGAQRLIALGDNFHDDAGPNRLTPQNKALLPDIPVIWITGNHDPALYLSTETGDSIVDQYEENDVTFCHIANPNKASTQMQVTGHFHPKASIRARGRRLSGPCFIHNSRTIILPSFGAYTGGLDINHPEIQFVFDGEYTIAICWKDKLYHLSKDTYLENKA